MEAIAPAPEISPTATPLADGDHLTRAEFERRYDEMPLIKKAELIEGIVHMGSPVYHPHAKAHMLLSGWLSVYASCQEGLDFGDNLSVRLDLRNEFQPDLCLWKQDGQASLSEEGFLEGAPELAAEISVSSVSYDLHTKKSVYERSGVREYIVWIVQEKRLCWWFLDSDDSFVEITPDPSDGLLHSRVFEGLKLDPEALVSGDLKKVISVFS